MFAALHCDSHARRCHAATHHAVPYIPMQTTALAMLSTAKSRSYLLLAKTLAPCAPSAALRMNHITMAYLLHCSITTHQARRQVRQHEIHSKFMTFANIRLRSRAAPICSSLFLTMFSLAHTIAFSMAHRVPAAPRTAQRSENSCFLAAFRAKPRSRSADAAQTLPPHANTCNLLTALSAHAALLP